MAQQFDRRSFSRLALALGCAPAIPAVVPGIAVSRDRDSSKNEKSPADLITPEARATIERGLRFLYGRQVKSGRNRGAFGNSGLSAGVATCSLSGLAFMCGEHAPGFGKYGKTIDLCVEFILKNVRDTGYIARRDNTAHENMYGHGFSMLFLSQAYGMTRKGEIKARKMKRALILLKADEDLTDPQIMDALDVSRPTVERIRKRFVEGGLDRALNEDPRPGQRRKLDGRGEAQLVAIACSKAPAGHDHWTVRLLAGQLVELGIVESISHETVRMTLKKTN